MRSAVLGGYVQCERGWVEAARLSHCGAWLQSTKIYLDELSDLEGKDLETRVPPPTPCSIPLPA